MKYRLRVETKERIWRSDPAELTKEQASELVNRIVESKTLMMDSEGSVVCFMPGVLSESIVTLEKVKDEQIAETAIEEALRPLRDGIGFREIGDDAIVTVHDVNSGTTIHTTLSELRKMWETNDKLDRVL